MGNGRVCLSFPSEETHCEDGGISENSNTALKKGQGSLRSPRPLSAQVPGLLYSEQFFLHLLSLYELFHVCFPLILGCNPEVCCNISLLIISASTKFVYKLF